MISIKYINEKDIDLCYELDSNTISLWSKKQWANELKKEGIKTVGISFGSPYLPSYESLDAYMCTYGYGSISVKAAANALWGRSSIDGKLPVT